MSLTVITTNIDDTRRLQEAWAKGAVETLIVVRVITTHTIAEDPNHVLVTAADGSELRRPCRLGAELWRGFLQIEPKSATPAKPHPWALPVDAFPSLPAIGSQIFKPLCAPANRCVEFRRQTWKRETRRRTPRELSIAFAGRPLRRCEARSADG
jgi:hypothetical protein